VSSNFETTSGYYIFNCKFKTILYKKKKEKQNKVTSSAEKWRGLKEITGLSGGSSRSGQFSNHNVFKTYSTAYNVLSHTI
jgi:hypothetical protein